MNNREIAKLLRHVAAAYTIKDEAKFRFQIIAYQKAADAIESATGEMSDLLAEGKLELLPGVGPSIRSHIEELLKSGKVKRFAWVMERIPTSMFPLLDIPTFGPKKAYKLVKEFRFTDPESVVDDIEKAAKEGKIASIPGFGEKSQEDILRSIEEFRQGKGKTTRMVLPFAFELGEKLLSYLRTSSDVKKADVLGSLRRMKETIGDIDIAVGTNSPKAVIAYFTDYPYKERIIEEGPMSASILTSGGKQVDLMTVAVNMYGSLLQHFTGSKNHNIKLREYGLSRGLSLSERGIKHIKGKKTTLDTFETEEAFYKALGMSWIPPEIREDTGEIEFALQNKLPTLVGLSDIKGDFHIHSSYPIEPSHDLGKHTMEEMLSKANELGYAYLGFSEHNPSVSKHSNSQIYSIMAKRKEKIEQLKSSNKDVRVINLLELDILSNGKVAIDEKSLSMVDALLVSIHSSFSMDKKTMTKRVLAGLSHPKAKVFCHPTGRLLNQRAGYDLEWEELFAFCETHKKALEINAWPYRLDLPDVLVRQAVKSGVRMVINTDSHSVPEMDLMKYGVAVARRGWAQKHDIINTLTYEEVMKWLKE